MPLRALQPRSSPVTMLSSSAPPLVRAQLEPLRAQLVSYRRADPTGLCSSLDPRGIYSKGIGYACSAAQVRQGSSPWRKAARAAIRSLYLRGESVSETEKWLISSVAEETDLERGEIETIVRTDVDAVVSAAAPRTQSPEIFGPMPTGAEQIKPITPASSSVWPSTQSAAPSLALPPPTSDYEGVITTGQEPPPHLALPPPAPTGPFTPEPLPYGPPPGAQPGPMVPSVVGPSSMMQKPSSIPWIPIVIGTAALGLGVYLYTRKKKRK